MDQLALEWLNGFSGQSYSLDRFAAQVNTSPLFKGLPPMLLVWGLWFHSSPRGGPFRNQLIATLFIAFVALFVARVLQVVLPFSPRPVHTPELSLVTPLYKPAPPGIDWSSFPSDHAVMFFALAACFFQINRLWGVLAFAHAFFIATLPRVFFGAHWPSDVLGGALLGIALTALLFGPASRFFARPRWDSLITEKAHFFYPTLFFVTFQIATLFNSARHFASSLAGMLKQIILG